MDPTRINNYNKFLATLDQKSNLNEKEKNAVKILSEKFKESNIENTIEKELKTELEKTLDKIKS